MKLSAAMRMMMIAMDLERKKCVMTVDERRWIIQGSWVRQQRWLASVRQPWKLAVVET